MATKFSIPQQSNFYLDPARQLHASPRHPEGLEQRNRALVEALTKALERIHELTQELIEVRR